MDGVDRRGQNRRKAAEIYAKTPSERNFARVFTRDVGVTPARFVERARVEGARRRLEESADGVEMVAARCGFGSAEVMRRAFLRLLGVPPSAYRGRFRSAG